MYKISDAVKDELKIDDFFGIPNDKIVLDKQTIDEREDGYKIITEFATHNETNVRFGSPDPEINYQYRILVDLQKQNAVNKYGPNFITVIANDNEKRNGVVTSEGDMITMIYDAKTDLTMTTNAGTYMPTAEDIERGYTQIDIEPHILNDITPYVATTHTETIDMDQA
jgi:hypothetical protein